MNRIQFGMPTPMECRNLEELIGFCLDTGYDFIELNANLPPYIRESIVSRDICSQLKGRGIGYSIHMPEAIDIGSLQSELRDAAISMLVSLASAAGEGTRFVCHMNSGIHVSLPSGKVHLYERYEHEYLDSLEDAFGALDAFLSDSGCKLCMENLGNFHLPFIQKGLEMLLSSEHIGLTWDFGHDATAGFSDAPFFERHLDKVWEIHLHDSHNGSDHHPLYTGNADKEKALALASEKNIPVVVEVKTFDGLRASYGALRERGYA